MRGSNEETKGKQGFAFFFHKGSLGMSNMVMMGTDKYCKLPQPSPVQS